MKTINLISSRLLRLRSYIRSIRIVSFLQETKQRKSSIYQPSKRRPVFRKDNLISDWFSHLRNKIKSIGDTPSLDEYERRKLAIFNQLNIIGLLTGIIVPFIGLFNKNIPAPALIVVCSPILISVLVLLCNYYKSYEVGVTLYFVSYPFFTSLIYASNLDMGVELFFVLYGVLSVFFLQRIGSVIFSFSLSMICYFVVYVMWDKYGYQLKVANFPFFFLNHVLAVFFIFYGLYLIKRENTGYQLSILQKNSELYRINIEIEKQKTEIAEKASLLEEQTIQLSELNSVKNKLFSIISHDLKGPMYALRNLFVQIKLNDLTKEEIREVIPDVINDLNYTTGLMENLLHWAKSQMQKDEVQPQLIDISQLISEVLRLLRLQAEAKGIYLNCNLNGAAIVFADRDMINLVLRNLVSNAIKFTPQDGTITVGITEKENVLEVYVKDTGTGISDENLQKLLDNNYYTTQGTANEAGTGLGLMICKEFLLKNGGEMIIKSEPGKGSIFSFTLPCSA